MRERLVRGLFLASASLVLLPAVARAQEVPPAATPVLEPPTAIGDTTVAYPAGAPAQTGPIVVRVKLLVGADGTVQRVELLTRSLAVFDDAVVRAAGAFRFTPARSDGQAIPVEIDFTPTFQPPPAPPPPPPSGDAGPPRTSSLRGRLVELGTGQPVAGATVGAQIGDRQYSTEADAAGRFELPLPEGTARVTVHAQRYRPFLQRETLVDRESVNVTYMIERERYDPYETTVRETGRREEVARISLRGRELSQVPGTFGDPFRVIQTLPGVVSAISLLPYPIVRGTSPSSTGFLLDGTRVPLLYHLLAGPSVVHPEFIDEIRFFPGGAPVPYGGYTGGIVDGRTRRARSDERLIDADVNLVQAGLLVRQPIRPLCISVTAAARYGYPGLLLGLATNEASLSYWDYQLRLDGGTPRNGWTVFAFGARDVLETVSPTADPIDPDPPLAPALVLGFHRLDLRASLGGGKLDGNYRLVLGYDQTESAGISVSSLVAEPSMSGRWRHSESFSLVAGLEGSVHDTSQGGSTGSPPEDFTLTSITDDLKRLYVGSAYLESLWRPTPRWLVRPGVRADVLHDGATTKTGVDPRLTLRYRLATRELSAVSPESDESGVWMKGSIGLYHQPPRFVLPLPGLDTMPLRYGLLQSLQTSLGAEVPLESHFTVSVEGYYSDLDPTIFDLSVNAEDLDTAGNPSLFPTTTDPGTTEEQEVLDRLLRPQRGRAYGLEVLIRRESRTGFYGWLSYTLSRSERRKNGVWVPYDFDRSHVLNLVAGLPLPRNWDLSVRFQYQSGKPATTTYGYNAARTDGYARIDLRVDKRAVWFGWLLDFYVDITNVALLPEEITPGATIRYVLPTVGVRGRF